MLGLQLGIHLKKTGAGSGASRDYSPSVESSLEHAAYARHNDIIVIDSTHLMLAYADASADGNIKTLGLSESYAISNINSLEHDTTNGEDNSLVMIDSTHFILAYDGPSTDGTISTFSIDGSYNVTKLQSLTHDTGAGYGNKLIKIDSTHFILAYSSASASYIKTFSINGSYEITQIDSYEFFGSTTRYGNSFTQIDNTHYAIAYRGTSNKGTIKIVSIDGSYAISGGNSIEHDETFGSDNSLIAVDATHLFLAYAASETYTTGSVKTFTINGSYELSQTNALAHETSANSVNCAVVIDATHVGVAYKGADSDGYFKVFELDESYAITEKSSLEFDEAYGAHIGVAAIDEYYFAIAYEGDSNVGTIKIINVR